MNSCKKLGIDIGSTTVKVSIIEDGGKLLFADYKRHFANIQETLADLLREGEEKLGALTVEPVITGSGGLTLSKHLGIPFVQEVVAVATSLKDYAPQTDVAIELGGEDAKIIYFTGGIDQRMNGICAGGTGSFIDQMASLLQTDASGLNEYAKNYKAIYPIAARCGVFAKTDIQPLINEGATKEDLSASIFQAVVNQTISGLACGKPIRGNVAFLGGPLHFLPELRAAFIRTLNLGPDQVIAPDHSHLFAAIGAAMNSDPKTTASLHDLIERLSHGIKMDFEVKRMEPLFTDEADYEDFKTRHASHDVKKGDLSTYEGKCRIVGERNEVLRSARRNHAPRRRCRTGTDLRVCMAAMQTLQPGILGRSRRDVVQREKVRRRYEYEQGGIQRKGNEVRTDRGGCDVQLCVLKTIWTYG